MTPNEEMENALTPILGSMRMSGVSEEEITAYRNGFTTGAMWRNTHPHWISVDEEMPPRWETNPNVSVPVITCKFVNRELQDIDLQRYVFGDSKWQYGDATHWMPFQYPKKGDKE